LEKAPKTNKHNAASTKINKGKKKAAGNKKKSAKKAAALTQKSSSRQSGSCPGSADCLDLAVIYMNLVRNKVATYQKQTTRFTKLSSASNSKSGKQNAFANTLNQLITAGGGNVSNLTCGSSTNNTGELVL
jgi:hypothetical protein